MHGVFLFDNHFLHSGDDFALLSNSTPGYIWEKPTNSKRCVHSSVHSVQFSRSIMSNSLQPHEPHRMPGFPVHHQLPEFTQTHVHWVDDAIQPSHPLSSPSPPAFNLSQHQGLFKWVSSSHQAAKCVHSSVIYNCQDKEAIIEWIKMGLCVLVAHLCLTLFDPMDYSPPGSSVCRILQVRIL